MLRRRGAVDVRGVGGAAPLSCARRLRHHSGGNGFRALGVHPDGDGRITHPDGS